MDFLMKPALTLWLFGGIDVCWLALILTVVGVVAAVAVAERGRKKGTAPRKRIGIAVAIAAVAVAAGCVISVLTDATEAVETTEWVTLFGLTVPINRVAFTLNLGDGYDVYWYGILIAAGFLLALWYGFRKAPAFGVDRDRMMDVVLIGMVAAIACARAFYIIGDDTMGFDRFFDIHNGGLAIYGGIIGALVFGGLTAWGRRISLWDMFDLAAVGFPIGQAVGRWGNFVNQEVYGRATGSDWFGMIGSAIGVGPEQGAVAVHPLFLYESLWCLGVFLFLHFRSGKRRFSGELFSFYLVLYGAARFFLESLRNPLFILRDPFVGTLPLSQIFSLIAVIQGVALFALLFLRSKGRRVPAAVTVAVSLLGAPLCLFLLLKPRREEKTDEDYQPLFGEWTADPEKEAAAYQLLGCEWDASDEELTAAYEAARAPFEAMEAETDEQRANVAAKLEELAAAYDFLKQARAAEEDASASGAGDETAPEESEAE